MNPLRPSGSIIRKIASGYARLAISLGLWLAASAVAVAAAAAIVWPLWALAVSRRSAYNLLFLLALIACAAAAAFFSIKRKLASGARPGRILRSSLSFLGLALAWMALALSGYLLLVLATRGLFWGAAPAGIVFIALSGYLFFGRKRAG